MDVADAFVCFANLLNRPCQVTFFRVDESLMKIYFETYEEFFDENMPALYSHFKKNQITSDLYITDWIFALFSKLGIKLTPVDSPDDTILSESANQTQSW